MFVIGGESEAGVIPHGNGENNVARENHGFYADFGQDFYHDGRENHDDHGARTQDETGIRGGVAVEALQDLRNQDGRAEERESKQEIVEIGDGEIAFAEKAQLHDGIGMAPLSDGGDKQSGDGDGEEDDDEITFEPVFGLAAVENDFQASESESDKEDAEAVDFEFAVAAGGFDFARELGRVGDELARQQERDDADRDVDEKDPAPAPIVGDPSTERRANGGGGDDGHAVESEGGGALLRREGVDQDGLLDRGEAATADSLENAEEDKEREAGSDAAEERAYGKEEHADHVIAFAAKDAAEPGGKGEDNGVGNEVAGEDPGAFVIADGEAAGDVGEGDVGDGGVEELHEGGQRDRECDDPGIDGSSRRARSGGPDRDRFGDGG